MTASGFQQDLDALLEALDRLDAELGRRLWQATLLATGRPGPSGAGGRLLERLRNQILVWCADTEIRERFGSEAVASTATAVEAMSNREFARYLRVLLDAPEEHRDSHRDAA